MINFLQEIFNSHELIVFFLSMAPIGELRFSIPYGIIIGNLSWPLTFILSYIGNLIISIILLLILNRLRSIILEVGFNSRAFIIKVIFSYIKKIYKLWEAKTLKRSDVIEKWGPYGLIFFVALPLPLTGAWTAVLLGLLLNINRIKVIKSILIGLTISGSIMTYLSIYLPDIVKKII